MNAVESQQQEVEAIARIIVDMLSVKTLPTIVLSYDEPTAFGVESNTIRIKMPFSLNNFNSIQSIAHECYHYVDFFLSNKTNTYSSEDRKIIETECDEYAYVYKFERDAAVFMLLFSNFFYKEIVGFNCKEEFPKISNYAKEKYTQLNKYEAEMILDYLEKKPVFFKLFESYKNELLSCYEMFKYKC